MRRTAVASCVLGLTLVLPTAVHAQTDDWHLPVSLAHIRAALSQPPSPLQTTPPAPEEQPMFRTQVERQLPLAEPAPETPFDPTYGIPSAGELMVTGIGKIRSSVVSYRRNRAERHARQEVADALAEFCAVQACATPAVTNEHGRPLPSVP